MDLGSGRDHERRRSIHGHVVLGGAGLHGRGACRLIILAELVDPEGEHALAGDVISHHLLATIVHK